LLINFFILGLFYIHFTYSIFIVTNNYLSYIFLSKVNNIFTPIANWYINNIILKYVNFLNYSLLFFILLGFYIAFISVRNILRYNLCILTPKITWHNLKNKLSLIKFGNHDTTKTKIYTCGLFVDTSGRRTWRSNKDSSLLIKLIYYEWMDYYTCFIDSFPCPEKHPLVCRV